MRALIVLALAGAALFGASPEQEAFEKRCSGCHAPDTAKAGPPLRGVFGRPAAKQKSYAYSAALRAAAIHWNRETLDRWLADPESLVPGTDMAFRLDDAAERVRIIAYLEQLK